MARNSRTLPLAGLVFALPVAAATEIERFNPEGLSQPDGYSQVVIAKEPRALHLPGRQGRNPPGQQLPRKPGRAVPA